MARLSGKVAIITGAASGQGAMEARLFAKEGAKVVATDMQYEKLSALVEGINEEYGEVALAIKQNVAEESQWQKVVERTIATFGSVHILVNNAGVTGDSTMRLDDYSVEEWTKVMNINALSNFLGIKYTVPHMKVAKGGSIVNISSLAGISGIGGISAYGASKGATRTLTKGAAVELGKNHIRVNSIHPGYIETPMIQNFTENDDVKKGILSQIPLGYLGKPEDVANAVLFLASDESKFITGAEIIIDGGQSIS